MNFNDDFNTDCDGLVVLFDSNEPKFSYATLDKDGFLVSTSEKVVISNHASTGTYYFKDIRTFKKYYEKTGFNNGEHFIAPIYNSMIKDGLRVQSAFASEVFPLGTPDDLSEHQERLLKRWKPKW
jgi:dTDP-glucose pyrophosphorylase